MTRPWYDPSQTELFWWAVEGLYFRLGKLLRQEDAIRLPRDEAHVGFVLDELGDHFQEMYLALRGPDRSLESEDGPDRPAAAVTG